MGALRKIEWFHYVFNTDFDFVFLLVVILEQKYKPSSEYILKEDLVTAQSLMGNIVSTEVLDYSIPIQG